MIILEKPYISDFLQKTALENNFSILKTEALDDLGVNKNLNIINDENAVEEIKSQMQNLEKPLVYCNSENAIEWIAKNLDFTEIPKKIELFKDKIKFRKIISQIYPDFYFEEVNLDDLEKITPSNLKYPLVLKPSVGFLSFGVYMIYSPEEWSEIIKNIKDEIRKFKDIYPLNVVNASKFIIEEMIDGDEFALDAYYNSKGEPIILNIFKHPFSSGKDVSDRIYYTSKPIMEKYLSKFQNILEKIGECAQLKNFPAHIEMRVKNDKITPIELNPMRFAGWCMTDMAHYAWGINPYEAYFNQTKPDWEKILKSKNNDVFYVLFADVPSDIDKQSIKSVDMEGFLKNLSKQFEVRKIDYLKNPLFAIILGQAPSENEIDYILKMDFHDYLKF